MPWPGGGGQITGPRGAQGCRVEHAARRPRTPTGMGATHAARVTAVNTVIRRQVRPLRYGVSGEHENIDVENIDLFSCCVVIKTSWVLIIRMTWAGFHAGM